LTGYVLLLATKGCTVLRHVLSCCSGYLYTLDTRIHCIAPTNIDEDPLIAGSIATSKWCL